MRGEDIEQLIKIMARLPGLGPRSARRAVLHLLRTPEQVLDPLITALTTARNNVSACTQCGNLDTHNPCTICTDPRRDLSYICVVETVGDVWALERAQAISGHYHILGGRLSALDGVGPEDLNLENLRARAMQENVQEIILALNATVEGQSTAHYIMDMLHGVNVKITRLAHGVPVGGELDYLDEGTLATAVKSRSLI